LQPSGVKTPKLKNLVITLSFLSRTIWLPPPNWLWRGKELGLSLLVFSGPPENIELLDVNIFSKKVNYDNPYWVKIYFRGSLD